MRPFSSTPIRPSSSETFRNRNYFGNAVGESGTGNFGGAALVNAVDSGAVRDNPHNPYVTPAPLDDFADYNRDQWVNAVDFGLVRDNATNPTTALKLITAPSAGPLPAPEEAPAPARIDRATLHDAAIGELNTEQEDLAEAERYLPDLSWLDAFDSPATQGRSSKIGGLTPRRRGRAAGDVVSRAAPWAGRRWQASERKRDRVYSVRSTLRAVPAKQTRSLFVARART